MAAKKITHLSADERKAQGEDARGRTPPSSHRGWRPAEDRPDPVALLEEQNTTREPDLVPVRHGRMMVSPFTFYRGAAKIMAADLKDTPTAGLVVQLCGDAHLSNFGVFASPERKLLFDLNDFDETLPGPFEYDVKRMAASFTIAARNNGFSKADTRASTLASVAAYREAMAEFAQMRTMDIWYAHLTEDDVMAAVRGTVAETKKAGGKKAKAKHEREVKAAKKAQKTAEKTAEKAHTRDSLQALSKLGELVDGRYRIVSQPPIVVPARELKAAYGMSAKEVEQARCVSSCAPTGPRCRTIGVICWSVLRSWTWPARWWAWAASAPARSSSCSRDVTRRTRCSCRSRRPPRRCWRITCRRAATSSPASGWCMGNG